MGIYVKVGRILIRSMTGFGKAQLVTEKREINVEVKSVNNRYLDVNFKMPRFLNFAEENIKILLKDYITRGKLDFYISVSSNGDSDKIVIIDKSLANEYIKAFKQLCEETELIFDITASRFLNNSDIVKIEHPEQPDEEIWLEIKPVIEECLINYNEMRIREGERLKTDIYEKADIILAYVEEIEKIVPENIASYKERLFEKIKDALDNYDVDQNRIITEVAIYTDKVCVDEETVRLKSHLTELKSMLDKGGPIGKKLDFLIQEMNREINTIGSKGNDLKISRIVVNVKNEIEKIREQIQNIE